MLPPLTIRNLLNDTKSECRDRMTGFVEMASNRWPFIFPPYGTLCSLIIIYVHVKRCVMLCFLEITWLEKKHFVFFHMLSNRGMERNHIHN